MENNKLIPLAIVVGAIILGGFYYVGQKENADTDSSFVEEIKELAVEDKDEFKEDYMEGCAGEDASVEYCECTYQYLIDSVGIKGVAELGLEYIRTEEYPEAMTDAVIHCIDKL